MAPDCQIYLSQVCFSFYLSSFLSCQISFIYATSMFSNFVFKTASCSTTAFSNLFQPLILLQRCQLTHFFHFIACHLRLYQVFSLLDLKTHYGRVQRQNPKIVSWSKKWLNQTLKHLMSHCLMGNSQPITGRHHFLAPPYSLPIGPYKGATFRTTSHNAVNVSTILYLYCRRKSRCSLQLCMFLSTGGTITKNIFLYLNCCITGWRRCNIKLIWIILYLQ